MRISSSTRLAAGLLLVYPALIVALNARAALRCSLAGYLVDGLLLVLLLAIVAVQLWRGRRWAYATALVCSGALTAILVLYELVVWSMYREDTWQGWSPVDHVLHFLPFVTFATAFVLLVKDTAAGTARRSALTLLAVALGVELVLMALIARFGVGGLFGGNPWYQETLSLSQVPGEIVLTQMGMCCGYENHNIISDWFHLHWGGINPQGIPVLVTANALGLVPLLVLARALPTRGFRARRASAAFAA